MMFKLLLTGLLLVGSITTGHSQELSFEEIMSTFGPTDEVEERSTTGKIEALDLAERKGTIGGYRYYFGPSTLSTPLRVRLLGRDFGSLQLLENGMDVRVYYFSAPSEHRIAIEIIQIEESEQH
jgi:hypothetical protein